MVFFFNCFSFCPSQSHLSLYLSLATTFLPCIFFCSSFLYLKSLFSLYLFPFFFLYFTYLSFLLYFSVLAPSSEFISLFLSSCIFTFLFLSFTVSFFPFISLHFSFSDWASQSLSFLVSLSFFSFYLYPAIFFFCFRPCTVFIPLTTMLKKNRTIKPKNLFEFYVPCTTYALFIFLNPSTTRGIWFLISFLACN